MPLQLLRVLACLLLADGEPVRATRLRAISTPDRIVLQQTLKTHLQGLRRAGCLIERVGGGQRRTPLRYRLLAIPPDDLLEDVLTIVHELQRRPRAPIPFVARGSVTTPSVRHSSATATRFSAAIASANGR